MSYGSWGASTVKWTSLDPCLVVSESDSILYTNFKSCEKKITCILKTCWSTKPSNLIYDDKINSKKSLHILEDGASGVQVGDIEQVIV